MTFDFLTLLSGSLKTPFYENLYLEIFDFWVCPRVFYMKSTNTRSFPLTILSPSVSTSFVPWMIPSLSLYRVLFSLSRPDTLSVNHNVVFLRHETYLSKGPSLFLLSLFIGLLQLSKTGLGNSWTSFLSQFVYPLFRLLFYYVNVQGPFRFSNYSFLCITFL